MSDMHESEWNNSPLTQLKRKDFSKRRQNALVALLATARESTDPKVRDHAASIDVFDHVISHMGGKTLEEEMRRERRETDHHE